MRKTSRLLTAAGGAALLLGLVSAEGSAQNSHWFYGNYGHYDGMTWGAFPPPPPPPPYPPARQYEDPYAEPAPADRPPRQRQAYQPPGLDESIEAEPGKKPPAAQPMSPRKPKSATAALGGESDEVTTGSTDEAPPGQGTVSCDKARGIVAEYGFKDIKADSCSGKTYGFSATRDGKNFLIKIVAANGELAEVRRQ